jgi:hypothetical protein
MLFNSGDHLRYCFETCRVLGIRPTLGFREPGQTACPPFQGSQGRAEGNASRGTACMEVWIVRGDLERCEPEGSPWIAAD